MAKNQGQLNFGIGFNVNTASLNKVRDTLKSLKAMTGEQIKSSGGTILDLDKGAIHSWKNNLKEMRKDVEALEIAFEKAYNPKLGTYELNKFNASLKDSGTTAAQAFSTIVNYGADGKAAILDMTTGMLAFERVGRQANETFKKLGDTMLNTIRWSITSSALNTITGSIQQAFYYSVDLDRSLNDIMIVTDKSSREMELFAKSANKAAKALGMSTKDYTDASLIYYQQGLSDKEVKSRTETTLKVAAVTGQSAETVSEQLTAVWNGYKVSAGESELYIDKLAAVAADTATDLEELSTGMSKVASAANVMGVGTDQLNAQLATIISVTREAPESVGTALKTVYARMSDIEAGLDTETSLGEYTSQMAQMGINVLDAKGKLRDMGDVVEEIGGKWNTLNREQQVSLAQSVAGTRQYSRMMALFDNWDMYQESLTTSMESAGTLSRQHIKYLNSIEAHQEKVRTSAEGLYDTIFDSEQIKGVYDTLSGIITLVDGLVKGLGGMPGILATIGMLVTTFGKQSIQNLITQHQSNKLQKELYKSQIEAGKAAIIELKEQAVGNEKLKEVLGGVLKLEDEILNNADNLTEEQFNSLQGAVKQYAENLKSVIEIEKKYNTVIAEKAKIESQTPDLGFSYAKQINNHKYLLSKEEDSSQAMGIKSAKGRLAWLQKQAAQEKAGGKTKLTKKDRAELKYLEEYIPLAERRLELDEEEAKVLAELEVRNKNVVPQLEDLEKGISKLVKAEKAAAALADITQDLSQIGFSAAMASGAVDSFASALNSAEVSATDVIGVITGIGGALGSLTGIIVPSVKTINTAVSTGKWTWDAYWASATMGLSILITGLTTILSIIKNVEQAKIDEANATIEKERETQKEIKANLELEKSYLKLYEEYKKTGEETDELKTATQKICEALESEELNALAAAGAYELLAEKIREKTDASYDDAVRSANIEKSAAENKLKTVRVGNVSGIAEGNYSYTREDGVQTSKTGSVINLGSLKQDDNKINAGILKKIFDGDEIFWGEQADNLYFKPLIGMTAEEKYRFYTKLQDATADSKWKNSGKVNDNIREILDDPQFADAVTDYGTATKTLATETAARSISEQAKSYSKSTSLSTFKKDRAALIAQYAKEAEVSEDVAAARIDAQYAKSGSAEQQALLARHSWLKGKELAGEISSSLRTGLEEQLTLENVEDSVFNALTLIDLEGFEGNADKLIDLAKDKAIELQEEAWVAQSEERLSALDVALEKYEKAADKAFGAEKIKNLKEQNKILLQQKEILASDADILKKKAQEQEDSFLELAKKLGYDFSKVFTEGVEEGEDWEYIQNLINTQVSEISTDDSAQLQTALTAAMQASTEYQQILLDIIDKEQEVADNAEEMYAAVQEAHESAIDALEAQNELIQQQIKLYQLLNGEKATSNTVSFYSSMVEVQRKIYEAELANYNDLLTKIETGGDEAYSKWGEEFIEVYQKVNDAQIQLLEGEKLLYEQKVESLINTELLGGLGINDLDLFREEQDWIRKNSDKYFDEIDRNYQISNLEYEFNKAIRNTTSLKAQQQLNKLKEQELSTLKEMDKLSENNVKRTEKLLELEQARIALEEAQNNKSQMRLVRGADGTYGYQYVADQSAIAEAEQRVAALENELINMDEEAWKSNLDAFYEDFAEFIDKLREFAEDGFTDEEKGVLALMWNNLQEYADNNVALLKTFAESSGESFGALMTMTGVTEAAFNKLSEFLGLDLSTILAGMPNAGLGSGTTSGVDHDKGGDVVSKITEWLLENLIKSREEKPIEEGGSIVEGEGNEIGIVDSKLSEDDEAVNAHQTYYPNDFVGPLPSTYIETAAGGKLTKTTEGYDWNTLDDWEKGKLKLSAEGEAYWSDGQTWEDGSNGSAHVLLTANDTAYYKDERGRYYVKVHPADDTSIYGFVRRDFLMDDKKTKGVYPRVTFDTGGYTGDWHSSEGRVAMLHEKELILNKGETKDFIDALAILRSLNMSMLERISWMGANSHSSALNIDNNKQPVEQNVSIYADFPNVSDKNEIEEAFKELYNLAMQRSFERR